MTDVTRDFLAGVTIAAGVRGAYQNEVIANRAMLGNTYKTPTGMAVPAALGAVYDAYNCEAPADLERVNTIVLTYTP